MKQKNKYSDRKYGKQYLLKFRNDHVQYIRPPLQSVSKALLRATFFSFTSTTHFPYYTKLTDSLEAI